VSKGGRAVVIVGGCDRGSRLKGHNVIDLRANMAVGRAFERGEEEGGRGVYRSEGSGSRRIVRSEVGCE
jgi:hypothetical protein